MNSRQRDKLCQRIQELEALLEAIRLRIAIEREKGKPMTTSTLSDFERRIFEVMLRKGEYEFL